MFNLKTVLFSLPLVLSLDSVTAQVQFSDTFNRADASECGLGQADNTLGGVTNYFYSPIFPEGGTNSGLPVGSVIVGNALQNRGLDFGGVQFNLSPNPCTTRERGADIGQDLTIRVRLRVRSDANGRITYAGPYFRSRRAPAGDGIIGGSAADPSGGFWVQLLSTGEIRVLRLDSNEVIANTIRPVGFDSSVFHHLQVAVEGDRLEIAMDSRLQRITGCALVVTLPNTGSGNQGAAGIAFGTDARGLIGGQQADDLEVREYANLFAFPTSTDPELLIQPTNTFVVRGNNTIGSAVLSVCDILNMGTLVLDSTNSSWSATVNAGYITNAAGALIEILRGAGGSRSIAADISNLGTFRADIDFQLPRVGAIVNNSGLFELGTNVTVTFDQTHQAQGQVFNQSAGTLVLRDGTEVSGRSPSEGKDVLLNITGGMVQVSSNVTFRDLALNYNGGQISGSSPYLIGTRLRVGPGAAPAVLVIAGTQNILQTDLPAGQTLWVQGNNGQGSSILNATNGFANRGLLRVESIDSSWESGLSISAGVLTNLGTIDFGLGSRGRRSIFGDVLNLGTINAKHDLDLLKPGGVFDNQGTFDLSTNLTLRFERFGGQIFRQTAGTLLLREGTEVVGSPSSEGPSGGMFNVTGGTIQVSSNVTLRSLALNYAGGSISGMAPEIINTQLRVGAGAAPAVLKVAGTQNLLQSDLPAGQTLWVRGNGGQGASILNATNGFANHGLLRVESVDSSWQSGLSISAGVLTNLGTIDFGLGTSGNRSISGDVLNLGTINAKHDLDLIKAGGVFDNQGTLDLSTNLTLRFERFGGQIFRQTAGTLLLREGTEVVGGPSSEGPSGGMFNVTGGTVQMSSNVTLRSVAINYAGGNISGFAPEIINTQLRVGAGAAPAVLQVAGTQNLLQGDLPAGQTLWVQGNGGQGASILNATNGFANHGLLRVESIDSSWESGLAVSGGVFTNTATGVVNFGLGTAGRRSINGDVLNLGTINAGHQLELLKPGGVFENQGTIDLSTNLTLIFDTSGQQTFHQTAGTLTLRDGAQVAGNGGTLNIIGGTIQISSNVTLQNMALNYNNGQISGSPFIQDSRLRLGVGAAPAMLVLAGAQNRLQSDLPAGQTLWVQGNSRLGSALLTATNSFANRGLLRFESQDSSWGSDLSVDGILTNAAAGRMEINRGSAGPRNLNAQLFNLGTLRANYDVNLNKTGVTHTNAGLVEVTAGAALIVDGSYVQAAGETALSGGTIRIGSPIVVTGGSLTGTGTIQTDVENGGSVSPAGGVLTITGKLTQQAGGTLAFKTKETATEGVDSLQVTGAAALAGTLRVSAPAGYTARAGDRFTLLTAGSVSGTFPTLVLPPLTNHLSWSVTYLPTSVEVRVAYATNAVVFTDAKRRTGGGMDLSFLGQPNTRYFIDTSIDLVNWTTLTNFLQPPAPFPFSDSVTNLTRRFYRARQE